ncbi:MAG: hypothetical protein JRI23_06525, partial [Deltaproteobacteria bacterium]|nr:hypothetical protein [Deltaproteobacteria bacterium]MBW2531238.1 hypothetical protein [Deltaproteobacteria bacterium]
MRLLWIALTFAGAGLCAAVGCSDDDDDGQGGATTTTTPTATTTDGGAGGQGGTGGSDACSPQPLGDFTPTWKTPEPIYQERCTDAEVDELLEACFEGTTAACDAAQSSYSDCWDCLVSDFTDSSWGPIFDASDELGFWDRNWPGCVAHAEGDLSADGCGAKAAALWECGRVSCAGCLPLSALNFTADLAAFNACSQAASETGEPCATYLQEVETCTDALTGPIADQCDWTSGSWTNLAKRYGKLFCGTEPTGAGGGGGAAGAGGGAGGGGSSTGG